MLEQTQIQRFRDEGWLAVRGLLHRAANPRRAATLTAAGQESIGREIPTA